MFIDVGFIGALVASVVSFLSMITWCFILIYMIRRYRFKYLIAIGLDVTVIIMLAWLAIAYMAIAFGQDLDQATVIRPLFSIALSLLTLYGVLHLYQLARIDEITRTSQDVNALLDRLNEPNKEESTDECW